MQDFITFPTIQNKTTSQCTSTAQNKQPRLVKQAAMSFLRVSLLVALVISLVSLKPQTTQAEMPDIGTFMQIGSSSLSAVDWETGTMYFTSGMSGKNQVYRYMGDDEWPWQLSLFDDGINNFYLSESGKWGIIRASVGGSEQGQLYLMNMADGAIDSLTHTELDTTLVAHIDSTDGKYDTTSLEVRTRPKKIQYGSVVWDHDDENIFFRSDFASPGNFQVYKMNIKTREKTKVFDSPYYDIPASVTPDGSKLFVYALQGNPDNDLYLVDLQTLALDTLTNDSGGQFNYFYPSLMPDGKTVYLVSNYNSDGMPRVAKMTLGSPKLEYISGWIDPKWSVDDFGVSRDYKYMYAIVNEEGYSRLRIRNIQTGEEAPQAPLEGMYSAPQFDNKGNIYFTFSGPTYAPDVWKFNLTSKKLDKLTKTMYAGIDRKMFADPKLIKFKSFDGLEIPALLYLPPNYKKGDKIPFLVNAHGGPEGQAQPIFARSYQYFSLNGYGLLRVNPRGSSGYGKEFMGLDDYKNRLNSLKDYKAAVDWLIDENYTKPGKIGIYGGSYGGYVTLGMITEYPDLFSAAIDIVGISNFVSFLENTAPSRRGVREAEYGPLSDRPFLESISPLNKADIVRTPLLVIHGENDPRVPVGEARQMLAAVAKNGTPVDSLIFPDEGHGASKRVNVIAQYRKMVDFFDTYLKGVKVKGTHEQP